MLEGKTHFMGVRIHEDLSMWLDGYAKEMGISISQAVRQSIIELKGKTEALREAKNGDDIEVLKKHIGDMFRMRQTEDGLLLERIEPQTIVLGSGERRKKNARESKTA